MTTTKNRAPRIYKPIPPERADLLPETRQLLAEWLDWVEQGAPEHNLLWAGAGLCFSLRLLADAKYPPETVRRIEGDFGKAFLGNSYPFGGWSRYNYESSCKITHKNKHRLAWVRANLPEENSK